MLEALVLLKALIAAAMNSGPVESCDQEAQPAVARFYRSIAAPVVVGATLISMAR